jgi:hypothetical protein
MVTAGSSARAKLAAKPTPETASTAATAEPSRNLRRDPTFVALIIRLLPIIVILRPAPAALSST